MDYTSVYELYFKASKTCDNENEKRITKTVLVNSFRNGKHVTPEQQVEIAKTVLLDKMFYDLEYIKTAVKKVY